MIEIGLALLRPIVIASILAVYLKRSNRAEGCKYIWAGFVAGMLSTMGLLASFQDPFRQRWIYSGLFAGEWLTAISIMTVTALRMYRQGWTIRASTDANVSLQVSRRGLIMLAVLAGLVASGPADFTLLVFGFNWFMFLLPLLTCVVGAIVVASVVLGGGTRLKFETFLSVAAITLLLIAAWMLWEFPDFVLPLDTFGPEQLRQTARLSLIPAVLYLVTTLFFVFRHRTRTIRYARLHNLEKALAAARFQVFSRKWLLALAVLLAGALLIADVVFVLSYPMREFAKQFLLNAIGVALVSAGALGYGRHILHSIRGAGASLVQLARLVMVEATATAIVSMLILSGPPSQRQVRNLDLERLNDLITIERSVANYWKENETLPDSLDSIPKVFPYRYSAGSFPTDPVTRQPYGYIRTGDLSFEVCGTFALPGDLQQGGDTNAQRIFGPETNLNWLHPSGTTCFKRTIDPNLLQAERESENERH